MRFFRAILLCAALAFSVRAADLTGTWKAVFDPDPGLKTVSEMTFHLVADGYRLTGTAHMSGFPGDGPVTDGHIDGDHFTFTVITQNRWWAEGVGGSRSGHPKLTFTGTVHDGEMQIHLVYGSIMLYGDAPTPREYTMRATRIE